MGAGHEYEQIATMMHEGKHDMENQSTPDWPSGLAVPARRALADAGYTRLDQLADVREVDLASLHGMGPKALRQLRDALAARGLGFAP